MRHLAIQSVGTALAVESIHAVAVYRKKDGRVCHLHHVITYAGAERRPQREHERNARSYAEKMGHDPDGLEFLHVANFRPFAQVSGRPQAQGTGRGRDALQKQEEKNQKKGGQK
jgi:hypothetical protein